MSPPRALLVDDQADLRMLVGLVLSDDGFEVSEAPGGREALDTLAAGPVPDVVVLDVQMPVMDGWETLEAIRADARTAEVPVILCTVRSATVDRIHGFELGCDGFMTKPFEPEVLSAEVRAVLARAADERARVRAERIAQLRTLAY